LKAGRGSVALNTPFACRLNLFLMFLHINDSMTLEEVQDRFNECFPFLRIAFYAKPHDLFEGSEKRFQYNPKRRIGSIREKHYNGILEIKSWDTTASVERKMKDTFDLNTQVFRYDAVGCWIQTTLSDSLTLAQLTRFASDGLTANLGVAY
jgi:hypothetical protein